MFSYEMLVNTSHPLPDHFRPPSLCPPSIPFTAENTEEKRFMEVRAARHAERLFQAAKASGLFLYGVSGFRSYERQAQLFQAALENTPADALCEVAVPGSSEHQTGLALDVSCPAVSLKLTADFSRTAEGIWLKRHAPLYGFILRYPAGKEHITQVPCEPWHIRYVTRSLALCLTITGQALEEYYAVTAPSDVP